MLKLTSSILILSLLMLSGCERAATDAPQETFAETMTFAPLEPEPIVLDTKPFLSEQEYLFGVKGDLNEAAGYYEPLAEYKELHGAILPHHNVAHVMLADFYEVAGRVHGKAPYDLIVVLSPNHQMIGPALQVGSFSYGTYEGDLRGDREGARHLIEAKVAEDMNQNMLSKEHGQLIHMPYIKHFMGDVPVLSIVIAESGDKERLVKLSESLLAYGWDKNILYVASIDFSHYLSLEAAGEKDAFTEKLLLLGDSDRMFTLSDEWMDAPSTYFVFDALMEGVDGGSPSITNHTNSAVVLNGQSAGVTTSYFQVLYGEPDR